MFNNNEQTDAEEGYLTVDGDYVLTTPDGIAAEYGCDAGDHLFFEWNRQGDAVVPD